MKIATIIGPEDARNVRTHGHAGASTQMIPFAESFNSSMTAIAITPGDLQRELSDGDAGLQGHEAMKGSVGEGATLAHLLSEASAGISAGSKKDHPTEAKGVSRSGDTLSGEELALQNPLKDDLVKTASGKVETREAKLEGYETSQPSGAQQKDTSAPDTDPVNAKGAPAVDAGLKEALMTDAVQVIPQEKIPLPKEGHRSKETTKTQHEGKASKKEEAVQGMTIASALPKTPVTTETNASEATALLIPVTSALPIPPKDIPLTGDSSSTSAIAVVKSVRETAGKTQAAQKKNVSQASLAPAKTNGSPKQSADPSQQEDAGLIKGETRSSGGLEKNESASIASPLAEKSHSLSPEIAVNAALMETPIHGRGVLTSQPEKVGSVHTAPGDFQQGAGPITPQPYGTDSHKTLVASPTTLEVGVPGGTHGWLKVRAELAGDGVVHASVSSNSPAGTEMLRRELPSLTSYLHQEQLPVSSVVIHASSSGLDDRNFSGGSPGHDSGQGMTDSQGGARQESGAVYQEDDAIRSGISNEMDGQDSPLSAGYAAGGGWLSIRA